MKISLRKFLAVIVTMILTLRVTLPAAPAAERKPADTIRVLLVTGGHGFEQEPFLDIFRSFGDVRFQHVTHPQAQAQFRPEAIGQYDVVVLYDMWQKIDDRAKADFEGLFQRGTGLVVLHHAIANYNDWERYAQIIGAKYYLKKMNVNGVEKARSIWKHGVHFTVHIVDPKHPVTRGLRDFEIHDETYNLFDVYPGVTPLLTTTAPTSAKTIGWAKQQGKSRLVYIQLGHDHFAYENPNYRQLVHQAIRWTAPK